MASLFTKILSGEIPGKILHQDDLCAAIVDIQPQAPTHVLIFPKEEIVSIATAEPRHKELLGHLILTAAKVARELGLEPSGYRLVVNTGDDGGQTVPHIHVHLLGGRGLKWPPG